MNSQSNIQHLLVQDQGLDVLTNDLESWEAQFASIELKVSELMKSKAEDGGAVQPGRKKSQASQPAGTAARRIGDILGLYENAQ